MDTNGLNHETHEIHERVEPRMVTNGLNHETHEIHEKKIQNHEWTRMGTNGLNHETHEIHERKIQNHEWTRMGTNIIYPLYGFTGCQRLHRWGVRLRSTHG